MSLVWKKTLFVYYEPYSFYNTQNIKYPPILLLLGLDYCSTPESYNVNVKTIENLLFHGHWSTNNCSHCRRQCDQDIYVAYTEMTQMKASDRRISKLRVFFQVFIYILIISFD